MITIPVWVFVLLIVLASITALFILLIVVSFFINIFTPTWEPEVPNCPDEIDVPDRNDDPEAIPTVSRED